MNVHEKSQGPSTCGVAHILLHKAWKCKARAGKTKVAEEILLPIFLMFILAIVAIIMRNQRETSTAAADPDERDAPENIFHSSNIDKAVIHIVHSKKSYVDEVTSYMSTVWKLKGSSENPNLKDLKFKWYSSENSLKKAYERNSKSIRHAVILNESIKLSYSIRTNPDIEPTKQVPSLLELKVELDTCREHTGHELQHSNTCPVNGYFFSGFLVLQYIVDHALILHKMGATNITEMQLPNITMQNYPKGPYLPGMQNIMRILIPLWLTVSFLPFLVNLCMPIVSEKEKKIKDGLRMIGVPGSAYWLSYFEMYAAIMLIVSMTCTIIVHLLIIQGTSPVIMFVLLYLFGLSLITFGFAITPFFHKPKTAASAATYILTVLSLFYLLQTYPSIREATTYYLIPLRLISTVAFATAIDDACAHEYFGGVNWKDLTINGSASRVFWSILFLIFDTLLYGLIAVYLDNIIPNEYGVKQHPLYCFKKIFCWKCSKKCCCGKCSKKSHNSNLPQEYDVVYSPLADSDDIEPARESLRGREAIRIRDIRKTFDSSSNPDAIYALKGISMDIYQGQITAILGRNGAGKSTLISILTGGLSPSSGRCSLFGLDMANPKEMTQLRKMTGVCMQHDLHFEKLTVLEHLEFYGKLRGLDSTDLSIEIQKLLNDLKLDPHKDEAAEKLSGGVKRKLSVAIAMIGSPKFILLDEPSAGVDPASRKLIWSVLQSHKRNKVILLTTHSMDEADFLADRKAIIHEGVVTCMGSSLFLKMRFGIGYHLTVELSAKADAKKSDDIIRHYIPEAMVSRELVGTLVTYRLPQFRVYTFGPMFHDIEREIEAKASIIGFGISLTTLEEVFLKISSGNAEPSKSTEAILPRRTRDSERSMLSRHSQLPEGSADSIAITTLPEVATESIANLIPTAEKANPSSVHIICALVGLRLRRLTRSYMTLIFVLFMPIITLSLGFVWQEFSKFSNTEDITFSVGKKLYLYPKVNLALSKESNETFKTFVKGLKKIKVKEYSGDFRDLMDANADTGTFAAVSTYDKNEFNMRVNGTFLHSPAIALNLINQYHLNQVMGLKAGSLITRRGPFTSTHTKEDLHSFPWAVFVLGTIFMFVMNALVLEIVRDREIKIRSQLRANGVTFSLYFLPIFFVYFVVSLWNVGTQVAIVYVFTVEAFTNFYAVTTWVILLVLCIFPSLLFTAMFAYLFQKMDTAQKVFMNWSFIGGFLCHWIRILVTWKYNDTRTNLILVCVLCTLNVYYLPYAISFMIIRVYTVCDYLQTCDQLSFKDYWGWETRALVIIMLIQGFLFYLYVYIADLIANEGLVPVLMKCMKPKDIEWNKNSLKDDPDVLVEKVAVARFLNSKEKSPSVLVAAQDLRKSYWLQKPNVDTEGNETTDNEVLRGVNLLVEEGEVFGLLGHNGAGKTTLLKMIIAEEFPDSGRVWLSGHDMNSINSPALRSVGYCPQHDSLWENITLKEHIHLFMAIRGVKKKDRATVLEHFLKGLEIEEHAKKYSKELSGGTKRKLTYCMSALGSPRIVLLDEPSTGMDVTSKRFLWNTIMATFTKGARGAILTTHEMEEADNLCTRVAIMVNGSFVCIGSPHHLKSKFGEGYTLEVKIKDINKYSRGSGGSVMSRNSAISLSAANADSGSDAEVKDNSDPDRFIFLNKLFPSAKLTEQFGNHALYLIPKSPDLCISKTFSILQSLKDGKHIEEYSFSQTTLEHVFIQFSKYFDDE